MKINTQIKQIRNRKGFTLVELLVVIAIIAALAGLSYGPIMKHIESSARTEAISNGKNIYAAMLGFMGANDNSFPDDNAVTLAGGTIGATAEPYYQMLLSQGHMTDESYFHHKNGVKVGLASATKPNNDGVLAATENVWGYVEGLTPAESTSPFIFDSSTDGVQFLANTWRGKAIVINVDGGAKAHNLALGTTPIDPANLGQAAVVNVDRGTPVDIMSLVPGFGTVKTPL